MWVGRFEVGGSWLAGGVFVVDELKDMIWEGHHSVGPPGVQSSSGATVFL